MQAIKAMRPAQRLQSKTLDKSSRPSSGPTPCLRARISSQRSANNTSNSIDISKHFTAASLALAVGLPPHAAFAVDEATSAAASAAEAASSSSSEGLSPIFLAVAVTPVLAYILFNVSRSTVNPRAQFWPDFFYILVFCYVILNIFTIVVFKQRVY
jgi:hypothetical protein